MAEKVAAEKSAAETAHEQAKEVYKYARKVASEDRKVEVRDDKYAEQLKSTIQKLKTQLREEQEKLRATEAGADKFQQIDLEQASDPTELLRQRKVIATAYRRLANSKPELPDKESAVPGILALRAASDGSIETRQLIPQTQADLKTARRQLAAELGRLDAFRLLGRTLEQRIGELIDERDRQAKLTADDVAGERLAKLRAKEEAYHEEANALAAELKWFIGRHLAPMLAAERRGGPPVGDLLDVTDEMLGAGFTPQHKPKQLQPGQEEEAARRGKEYRRHTNEQVRRLMQDLLNAATSDEGDPDGWVEVDENSAPVHFLITAKVAMFHPDDARKVRLLDFAA